MKPRKYQILQIKAGYGGRGVMNRIKVWPCKYIGCTRVLNDVDYSIACKFCTYHKAVRITEKNHNCYVKRRGETHPSKLSLMIRLLKTDSKVSPFQLMAYSGVKDIHILRSNICNLNRQGYKIIHNKQEGFYSIEK